MKIAINYRQDHANLIYYSLYANHFERLSDFAYTDCLELKAESKNCLECGRASISTRYLSCRLELHGKPSLKQGILVSSDRGLFIVSSDLRKILEHYNKRDFQFTNPIISGRLSRNWNLVSFFPNQINENLMSSPATCEVCGRIINLCKTCGFFSPQCLCGENIEVEKYPSNRVFLCRNISELFIVGGLMGDILISQKLLELIKSNFDDPFVEMPVQVDKVELG